MINNIPHVNYVKFFVWLIIRGRDVLYEKFTIKLTLKFLDAHLGDIYSADIGALFEIPFNKKTCAAAYIKNMLSLKGPIPKNPFYTVLFSTVKPNVVRLAKTTVPDAPKIEILTQPIFPILFWIIGDFHFIL